MEVAIKLDLPQQQVTQFRSEYWRLQNQDELESLDIATKGKVSLLKELYEELIIERGISTEQVADVISIGLTSHLLELNDELVIKEGTRIEGAASVVGSDPNKLPDVERMLEQATKALARAEIDLDMKKGRIRSLEEEEIG
ncbi:MAG: hypothetical protein M3297_00425 [Thermoproteota archaeon]|nr:hypothetical protein [Thermoproteota archaeon]